MVISEVEGSHCIEGSAFVRTDEETIGDKELKKVLRCLLNRLWCRAGTSRFDVVQREPSCPVTIINGVLNTSSVFSISSSVDFAKQRLA